MTEIFSGTYLPKVAARSDSKVAQALIQDVQTQIDKIPNAEWDETLRLFSDIHYEQSALFGEGERGERPSHILMSRRGGLVAGAQLGIYMLPVVKRGLALLRFGPFWRRAGEPTNAGNYREALRSLIDEYCKRRKLYLVVRPRAHPDFYPVEADILEDMGFRKSNTSMLDRYFVDLSLSEDQQMKSLEQKWRYNLRGGLANNLEIRFSDDPASVADFQKIFAEMVGRKNLVYPGMNLVAMMPEMVQLPSEMKLNIAMAYDEGQPIGGLAFAVVGDVAYYVFGASSQQAIEKKAGYVLQWNVIRHLHQIGGIRWYELGGPGDPGIRQFKKGLAGKCGVMLPVQEFHFCLDFLSHIAVKGMFKARNLRNLVQRWQRGT